MMRLSLTFVTDPCPVRISIHALEASSQTTLKTNLTLSQRPTRAPRLAKQLRAGHTFLSGSSIASRRFLGTTYMSPPFLIAP
jgi:hypothetical protein